MTLVRAQDGERPGLIDTRASSLGDVVEGIAIEEPVILFENAFAPPVKYWHLDVPGDVSLALDADRAHRDGVTGRDVHVVMVDTGWYAHPFFTQRGYRVDPVVLGPGAANPAADEVGHGTAESANVFAAAPDARFTMVKQGIANATAAFNAAVALRPDIISCSWGFDIERGPLTAANQALAAAVATAVAGGIVVVFSAGNGHFGFPGQHPDVIAAGGVYMAADGATNASDYASGFASQVYPGRNVPDVSGLVGMQPRAAYIMLPVQPGDQIDAGLAGGTHPDADETAGDDGWAAISGTSAAAPQIAGVCALLKQACPKLTPAEIKDVLVSSARDVTAGACSARTGGHQAIVGPDLATGSGLVDAQKAVLMARARWRAVRRRCSGSGRSIRRCCRRRSSRTSRSTACSANGARVPDERADAARRPASRVRGAAARGRADRARPFRRARPTRRTPRACASIWPAAASSSGRSSASASRSPGRASSPVTSSATSRPSARSRSNAYRRTCAGMCSRSRPRRRRTSARRPSEPAGRVAAPPVRTARRGGLTRRHPPRRASAAARRRRSRETAARGAPAAT